MKSLLVTGNCPYNVYQEEYLKLEGIEAQNFGTWGMHLPDHCDEIISQKPDIVHLQWPEALTQHEGKDPQCIIDEFKHCFDAFKAQNIALCWTHHNLLPHAHTNLDLWKALFQVFATYTDLACHHSQCGLELMTQTYDYGDADHVILRHGYFHKEQTCTLSQTEARAKAGLPREAHIYLSIGALRPDKCIKELIDCFKLRDPKKDVLLIAGNIWSDYGHEMVARAADVENIIIEPGFIAEEKVSLYANAADAFLYMYGEHHLTSGSPHLSQAHLLPQISLDYAYAREVLGTASSFIAADEQRYQNLHTALDQLDTQRLRQQGQEIVVTRDAWSWPTIAKETKLVYEKLLS